MTMSWWLSFADASGFRGACIVTADDMISAVREAHRRRCNPGGQVKGFIIDARDGVLITDHWRNRLLTRADCAALDKIVLQYQRLNETETP